MPTESADIILKSIAEMKSDLSTLKSELNRIRSSSKPSSTTVRNVSGLPTSMDDMAADANDSIVTVDEDIPELSDEEGLNSQAPTI